MPSYKKGKKKGGGGSKKASKGMVNAAPVITAQDISGADAEAQHNKISDISCTGQCAMTEGAKDIKFISFSMQYHGDVLIEDTTLELNYGNRYGLIGRNGSGKTTFLRALATREVDLPSHVDCFFLDSEAPPSDMTALEMVIKGAQDEVARLESLEEKILTEIGPDSPLLMDIGDRLDELDPSSFEKRAGELLFGLGFKGDFLERKTKDMSGGWRMRVSLAQALFIRPTLLLLDEPTNHLDLETCVWLERYLKTYDKILVIVSHSQDFMNEVCTNMMHLTSKKKMVYYGGNYSTFVKTKKENEVQQMKQYEKQQKEIKHIKEFIASCGTYANMVKQAQSRQKLLDKMIEAGLIEPVEKESVLNLSFPSCEKLAPPVLALDRMGFSYDGNMENALYTNVDLGVDCDSRMVLVGPNGAGKSTLLNLFTGKLSPTAGDIKKHGHLKIAQYHQHSADILPDDKTPIEFMRSEYAHFNLEVSAWRQRLGKYGVSGKAQTKKIGTFSDGQKSQLVFCWLAQQNPHMLLFDEPTNHLDMESIDALADAINNFEGGMVIVSHDFRLLQQTAKEIIVCDNKKITRWDGDILSYKKSLIKSMEKNIARFRKLQK